jgi:hypothetical protein
MEQVAARDWYKQMIYTLARIKVFYQATPVNMITQIRKSEEAELEQHTEQMQQQQQQLRGQQQQE